MPALSKTQNKHDADRQQIDSRRNVTTNETAHARHVPEMDAAVVQLASELRPLSGASPIVCYRLQQLREEPRRVGAQDDAVHGYGQRRVVRFHLNRAEPNRTDTHTQSNVSKLEIPTADQIITTFFLIN